MPRKSRDADRPVTGEDVDRSLMRRILIWAQTWRRCPKKGCRRAGQCLRMNDCAGVAKGDYWPSEKDQRRYFQPIRAAIRAERDGPGHDPDARRREAPMPPAPGRS